MSKAGVLSLGGSVLFFILSNLMVWYGSSMYPPTMEGLVLCFTMAIPFFQNSVLGDLIFTVAMVGIVEYVRLSNVNRVGALAK